MAAASSRLVRVRVVVSGIAGFSKLWGGVIFIPWPVDVGEFNPADRYARELRRL